MQGSSTNLKRILMDVDEEGNAEAAFQFKTYDGKRQFYPFQIARNRRGSSFEQLSRTARSMGVNVSPKKLLRLGAGRYDVMSESVESGPERKARDIPAKSSLNFRLSAFDEKTNSIEIEISGTTYHQQMNQGQASSMFLALKSLEERVPGRVLRHLLKNSTTVES